jgi:hypothetical protein
MLHATTFHFAGSREPAIANRLAQVCFVSGQWTQIFYAALFDATLNGNARYDDDLESWNSSKAEKLLRYASMNIDSSFAHRQ